MFNVTWEDKTSSHLVFTLRGKIWRHNIWCVLFGFAPTNLLRETDEPSFRCANEPIAGDRRAVLWMRRWTYCRRPTSRPLDAPTNLLPGTDEPSFWYADGTCCEGIAFDLSPISSRKGLVTTTLATKYWLKETKNQSDTWDIRKL